MEPLLGKYLGAVDLLVVAVCATLVARAAATVLDSEVAQLAPIAARAARLPDATSRTTVQTKAVEGIINRNVFCSIHPSSPSRTKLNLKLLAVMFAPQPADPRWSIAIIRDVDSQSAGPYVVASRLGSATVGEIDQARVTLELGGGRREYLDLLEPPAQAARAVPAGGIRKTGEHRYEVQRTTLDSLLGNLSALVTGVRVVPETRDGRGEGFRLFGIRADSPLAQAGVQNGDEISAINGFAITTPDQALVAYTKLRTASHLAVAVERNGQRLTQDYEIR